MHWTEWNWTAILGDLHGLKCLTPHMTGVICIWVAGLCGAIVGLEREKREKPAGLRSLILICVGSSMFTMASQLIAIDRFDRGRIAAQVVAGIGFLGAGAIIHERRAVVGLTTAATIWSVAAIGILVGIGYAAAGIVLSFLIFIILVLLRVLEKWMHGPCQPTVARVQFQSERGKTRQRILSILDANHISSATYSFPTPTTAQPGETSKDSMVIHYCSRHRVHRSFLSEIASLHEVEAVEEVT